ncbi:MAG: hypothetical protein ABI947_15625 [Chloroflexota bacterium]
MGKVSRREFLKQSGIFGTSVAVGTHLSEANSMSGQPIEPSDQLVGRTFGLTDVHSKPTLASAINGQLTPDSVHSFTAMGDWYQTEQGYVLREAVQPILPYARPILHNPREMAEGGFWAEMVAPVSVIRAWCAGHADIVARLGFGAVVYVMDQITDSGGQVWYGLAAEPDSELVGWGSALHFGLWTPSLLPISAVPTIQIDRLQAKLVVVQGDQVVYQTTIYAPVLPIATTTIHPVQPGASLDSTAPLGVAWLMALHTGQRIYGTFWHNRFGTKYEGVADNQAIELPTFAARWLYELLISYQSSDQYRDQPAPIIVEIK